MNFRRGDHIVLRNLRLGRVSYVYPLTVIEDREDYSALYLAAGTPIKQRVMPDGSPMSHESPYRERHLAPPRVGDGVWRGNNLLMLTRPEEAHSFWTFWRETNGEFLGWYVNLQAPLTRTKLGFDTEDHILDIVIAPDGSWSWKDEDELEEAVEVGRLTREESEEIMREGHRAVEKVEAREWPLGSKWEDFRPEPGRTPPQIPEGWERV